MFMEENRENTTKGPPLGGGPLGYGDPDDLRLRKTEKDIILPKLLRQEAGKRCVETLNEFLDCSRGAGIMFPFKCQDANKANNECIVSWTNNPEFVKEVTDKYLRQRSHYRRTGEPVEKYERKKVSSSS